jgi:hypothetical protein
MVLVFRHACCWRYSNRRSKNVGAVRGSELTHDASHVYARNLEIPSGGAVGTARAIAQVCSVLATH